MKLRYSRKNANKQLYVILYIILLCSIVSADNDGTYHSAILGNSTTYLGKIGNLNLGLFFEERMDLVDELLERLEWFNTDLFRATSTGGAIAHIILLFVVIGMTVISEVSQIPAFMILVSFGIFFFSWLVLLSISIIIGVVLMAVSSIYMIRSVTFIKSAS